ncbi:MAG: hypothetical protein ABI954_02675 [Pyrinomonadaceae bacterium]
MFQSFSLKNTLRYSGFLMLATLLFGMTFTADAQTRTRRRAKPRVVRRTVAAPRVALYSVASNTKIRVRMEDTINSKTARVGDSFETRTVEPVYSTNGTVVIPEGSTIIGRVTAVTAARKGGKPGTIDVSFVQVRLPNGATRSINGSLADLDSKDAKSNNEGTASGDKMKYRKPIFIGGGAAGGAILGGAVGGGKGALIGGIIGGVGGLIGENQTKGENAEVKSGTEFGVVLNQAISMPKYNEQ